MLNEYQKSMLKHLYSISKYPSPKEMKTIGTQLGLTIPQVTNWFSRVRTKERADDITSVIRSERGKASTVI